MLREAPSPAVSTPYEREVVLLTTVDIAPGYSQIIELRRGDSAYNAARQFCRAHGLPDSVVGALEAHLQSHLDQAAVRFLVLMSTAPVHITVHKYMLLVRCRTPPPLCQHHSELCLVSIIQVPQCKPLSQVPRVKAK